MKFLKISLLFVPLIILMACSTTPSNGDDNGDDNGTKVPYDNRSLVPEDCAYLENLDDDWQPVWCDEFDEDGLPNPDLWGYDIGGGGWGNNELQYYTNANLNNAFIEDGVLNIRAIRENFQGSNYTSARLVTRYRGDWEYARIQVKARMPEGRGTWPAIWMLPTEWRYGGWPHSGEIDIMEYVGYDPEIIHGTIHTGAYNHNLNTHIGYSKRIPTANQEFHLYEMIWEPARILLFIDGEQYAQFGYNPETNMLIDNSEAWPFDQPFHLILNVAIGGDWGGQRGIDEEAFPTAMEVEYVRVYQKDYAGMDEEAPSAVSNLRVHWTRYNSARLAWNHATDDVKVSHYEVYAGDTLKGTTTLNAFNITGLNAETSYKIDIVAVDFAGNKSPKETVNIQTATIRTINDRIQAETFDAMRGVDTQPTEDVGGGMNVGWINNNDYMDYIMRVPEEGTYRISYRVASDDNGGRVRLSTLPRNTLIETAFDATNGWQTWETVTSSEFTLQEGTFTFRIFAIEGGFNLNYFEFEKVE